LLRAKGLESVRHPFSFFFEKGLPAKADAVWLFDLPASEGESSTDLSRATPEASVRGEFLVHPRKKLFHCFSFAIHNHSD
jgi:hypothetical protein